MSPRDTSQLRRRGRPSELRAETEEAAALVEFLRELTSGLTVRQIVEQVPPYGRTKWAGFLNGSQLIPRYLLDKLMREVVREPRLQNLRLEQGRELLDKAERAAAGKLAPHEMGLPERELRRRLDQAQRGMINAQEQLLNMSKLATGLVLLVARLQQRCADLDRAQHRSHQDLSEQRRQFEQRLQIAEHNLAEAQRRQHEAETLRVEALQRAERYRLALTQEQDASAAPPDAGKGDTAAIAEPSLEELEEYDALLEQSTTRLDETGRAVDELRRQLGIAPPEQETPSSQRPRLVRGQVEDKPVPEKTATSPPATSPPRPPEPGSDAEQPPAEPPHMPRILHVILGALAACVVVAIFGAIIPFALVDPLVHRDSRTIASTWLAAGAIPSQTSAPDHSNTKVLVYRLSTGQSVDSTFALPRLARTWAQRVLDAAPRYNFDGYIDFQPDRSCASKARLTWRLHNRTGRLPLTHEVVFHEIKVPTDKITLTARLDAPAPCTGFLRLINPEVANLETPHGKSAPPPEVATRRK
ncbi:hypothetical protein [Actinomadura sp. 9N215]|uniref:hypothetical protein n=1 Tax=Actinomadura sp. 9N215 TaxID=3375150 RepID=UPI0037B83980